MAAEPRRLAQLPGYDTAPDVYETADARDTDATSTLGTQSTRNSAALLQGPNYGSETSDSDADSADFAVGEDDNEQRRPAAHEHSTYGVSRRRLYPARARSRFGEASRGVETAGADLSDRVDGRRRGYRVRRRPRQNGREENDEEESLPARLARLRREVEECRVLAGKETPDQAEGQHQRSDDATGASAEAEDATALSRMLAQIEVPPARRSGATRSSQSDALATQSAEDTAINGEDGDDAQALRKISAFDARLAALETVLGISSLDGAPGSSLNTAPIIPTLTLLDAQLATLSSAGSLASLEAAGAKIQALQLEARNLTALQNAQTSPVASSTPAAPATAAAAAGFSRHTRNPSKGGAGINDTDSAAASEYGDAEEAPLSQDDDDLDETILADGSGPAPRLTHSDVTQLRALYAQLPVLQSLGPTLPALLARLRSLRAVHGTAARAADDLAALEQRQEALDRELQTWRAGLEKVQTAVREADAANGRNGTVVKEWVDGLEQRIESLRMTSR